MCVLAANGGQARAPPMLCLSTDTVQVYVPCVKIQYKFMFHKYVLRENTVQLQVYIPYLIQYKFMFHV